MALILILEDEPFIALDIELVLDDAGYLQHATLTTCAEAVDWLLDTSRRWRSLIQGYRTASP